MEQDNEGLFVLDPFNTNKKSSGPGGGMEKSFEEIFRVRSLLKW
ncbi:hypothetical protein FACS1894163_07740 [Spirochaetia bacterium]|nr:hypothetical protein FACS1894163_07740 [Spirochaetia bacterium]